MRVNERQRGALGTRWKERVRQLKWETWAVYWAVRDPRTPWYARLTALCVVGYALSPIDLIPDFVPVLGYLDDLLLVPLGLALAIRLIPQPVLDECRERANLEFHQGKRRGWQAGIVVVLTWLLLAVLAAVWVWRLVDR